MIGIEVQGHFKAKKANLRAGFVPIAQQGVMNFKKQMMHNKFPRNKDGTKRYGNSTKLINTFRAVVGDTFIEWSAGGSLPYARVQFLGGTTHPGKIKGMAGIKAHFWKVWYASGKTNEMARRIALTKKPYLTVKIRGANPFYLTKSFMQDITKKLGKFVMEKSF